MVGVVGFADSGSPSLPFILTYLCNQYRLYLGFFGAELVVFPPHPPDPPFLPCTLVPFCFSPSDSGYLTVLS